MKLFLIGMPGSGKSTLGAMAAKKLDCPFIDMDDVVKQLSGKTVEQLFYEGESEFRRYETLACRELSAMAGDAIVACGGGVVVTKGNCEILKQGGKVVYLMRPIEDIVRDIDYEKRPLLKGRPEALLTLYEERRQLYPASADATIANTGTLAEAVEAICKLTK